MDWLDLLAVQGTLKNLLQHHSSKASIHCHSAFFVVKCSHLYMTTGKTIALTIWTFVNKLMSLLFNALSRFVIAFLTRSKQDLLICKLAIFPRRSLCRGQRSVMAVLLLKCLHSNDLTLLAACVFFPLSHFQMTEVFSFVFFLHLIFRNLRSKTTHKGESVLFIKKDFLTFLGHGLLHLQLT